MVVMALATVHSVARPYCVLDKDTLRIGNELIERVFAWNDGHLMTATLIDKTTGIELRTRARLTDFALGQEKGSAGVLDTLSGPDGLTVRITFRLAGGEIRRDYIIRDGVPAIACETAVRGIFQETERLVLERLDFAGKHWRGKAVEFLDRTDDNNTLVEEHPFLSYHRTLWRGNLLFVTDAVSGGGFFFLKESPAGASQLHHGGADFIADGGCFSVIGAGISPEEIKQDEWTRLYGCVTGVAGRSEKEALVALRAWQKSIRPNEDMVMMNTWGDRGQDARVTESFCLEELERGARLGITCFQIDDGWQSGKSPNSVSGGSFKDIWRNPLYWTPDPEKYPDGLFPIVEKGREKGIEIGLWFNPSVQDDFANWEQDAAVLTGLFRTYGIRIFKIDGVQLPTKKAEENLRSLLDRVREQTDGQVIFNLDATAGRRAGYHYFGEYGNIFLENRYTDWGNYYPYQTLRNLWMLSRYVPAEKLQIEFLNPWRNVDKYPTEDPFAPSRYSFDYLAALTFAAQPLAWLEASNLPEEALETGRLIKAYREIAGDFHAGTILPVGEEPDGVTWTGFQSLRDEKSGWLLVYREASPDRKGRLRTWLPDGRRVKLTPVLGSGRRTIVRIGVDGTIRLHLKSPNSFALYRYEIR